MPLVDDLRGGADSASEDEAVVRSPPSSQRRFSAVVAEWGRGRGVNSTGICAWWIGKGDVFEKWGRRLGGKKENEKFLEWRGKIKYK